ncbi:MAG: mechanosensitive ion channel family protein [Candidatus Omnitrophota bacterium]|nr:MAG: mechanosensitive ion channel family protein [Candidatus Omnitrophota bacterium]
MQKVIGQNRVLDYIVCLAVFVACVLILKIFKHIILKRLKRFAEKTATAMDDFIVSLLRRVFVPLMYLGALYLSLNFLTLPVSFKKVIDVIVIAVVTFFTARMATLILAFTFQSYWIRRGKDFALERSLSGILKASKFIIWAGAIIFFLDNMGFKISTVIAGLGIGGVAIGLAAQAVLKDFFSYFSIIFDRPFEVGDFIIVGEYLGTVEYIGIKTTRIRSLSGEQLVFSNTDLTDSRVRNYKRMERRRVLFRLGVVYQTSLKQLKDIPKIIETCIQKVKDTVFDRAHFFSYGDFSLTFEVVYYVLASDYNKYMDIQQEINFLIKEEFEKQGIEFAYPTQTLYVNKEK